MIMTRYFLSILMLIAFILICSIYMTNFKISSDFERFGLKAERVSVSNDFHYNNIENLEYDLKMVAQIGFSYFVESVFEVPNKIIVDKVSQIQSVTQNRELVVDLLSRYRDIEISFEGGSCYYSLRVIEPHNIKFLKVINRCQSTLDLWIGPTRMIIEGNSTYHLPRRLDTATSQ